MFAGALDRTSTNCVAVGVVAPLASLFYGVGTQPKIASFLIGLVCWGAAGVLLHFQARFVLEALDDAA